MMITTTTSQSSVSQHPKPVYLTLLFCRNSALVLSILVRQMSDFDDRTLDSFLVLDDSLRKPRPEELEEQAGGNSKL